MHFRLTSTCRFSSEHLHCRCHRAILYAVSFICYPLPFSNFTLSVCSFSLCCYFDFTKKCLDYINFPFWANSINNVQLKCALSCQKIASTHNCCCALVVKEICDYLKINDRFYLGSAIVWCLWIEQWVRVLHICAANSSIFARKSPKTLRCCQRQSRTLTNSPVYAQSYWLPSLSLEIID